MTKQKCIIGLILILMASLAPVPDLNKMVFGLGIGLSYEYLVKQFTIFMIWISLKNGDYKFNELNK